MAELVYLDTLDDDEKDQLKLGLICYGTAQGLKLVAALNKKKHAKAGQHAEAMRTTWCYLLANFIEDDLVQQMIDNFANLSKPVDIDLTPYRGIVPRLGETGKP